VLPGTSVQRAFAIAGLQETVTLRLKDPAAVIWKSTGDDVVPRPTVTPEGEGGVMAKLMTCSVSGTWCVICNVSDPRPLT